MEDIDKNRGQQTDSSAGQEEVKAPHEPQPAPAEEKPGRKHKVSAWVRVPLKVLMWLIIVILLIPVLLYIPPVQTAVKDLACKIVKDETGMDVSIERFRLKFPLDVSLQGVSVVEATGDTMVNAREAIADIRLLPLLKLDVKVKRVELLDGYYRMVSPDSSMIMKIRAGYLNVDSKSSVNIAQSEILLNKVKLKDGDVSLYMNVWKQKPTPADTTSTPFYIAANNLDIERIRFSMSMLPTIDTMTVVANNLKLRNGIIDLRKNAISMGYVDMDGGDFTYFAPAPEYVAAHPAPVDTLSAPSAPMTIRADSIRVSNLGATYAIKGAKPLPGFDANYIQVSDVNVLLKDFYNCQANLNLPIKSISAKERCGLQIVSGSGTVALNEAGISIDAMQLRTLVSEISASADIPFALMELKPEAPVHADLAASIGLSDAVAFMPALSEYVNQLPRKPLNALVKAEGRLDNVSIDAFDVAMHGIFSIRANGYARNALDFKNLIAQLTLDGEVSEPAPLLKLAGGDLPVAIPPLKLTGNAGANRQNYTADFSLTTPYGSVLADGRVGLNSESYFADVDVRNLDVARFMPDLGVGIVSATLRAEGAGFNPLHKGAATDVELHASEIQYAGKTLRDISLDAILQDTDFKIDLDSPNPDMNLTANLTGTIDDDYYCAQGVVKVYKADLQAFGLSETENYGSANLYLDVTAQPDKWLYDATVDVASVEWYTPDLEINIPDGIKAYFAADDDDVHCSITARGTDVEFTSGRNLKDVVDGFSKCADAAMAQLQKKDLDVEELQKMLPDFKLTAKVDGNGLLRDFISPSGFGLDTVSLVLANDSLIRGNIYAQGINTGSMAIDTVTFNLKERGRLLDYQAHMGNRPGTLDEFNQVNVNGYLGSNRVSAYLTQKNLAGQTGYKFGFTGAVNDSTLSVHFTPMKATIAYMPWTFNDDNHIDYEFYSRRIDADLMASSRESSILLRTEPSQLSEGDDIHLNIKNIHIQDFLNMSLFAPPITADVDGDIRINYDGTKLLGNGDVQVHNLVYDKMMVGDLDLGLLAGVDLNGETKARANLKIDGRPAMGLSTVLEKQGDALEPTTVDLELTQFPLKVANAFLGPDVAKLSGELNGKMNMSGKLTSPMLNGDIACDSVAVFIPMMGSSLKFDNEPLTVTNNVIRFNKFDIYGQNENPLTLDGVVDATKFSDINFDLNANANNFQLINNDRRAKSDLYGKLFLNLSAGVKGPMKHFDINANLNILGTSDVYYTIPLSASSKLQTMGSDDGVVKFVNFSDTTQTLKTDTAGQMMAMRITAGLTITPGTQVTVNLSNNGTDKVQLSPSGNLNYFQNFMGDMTLNGQLVLGNGFARYNIPVMGQKTFTFSPQSSVLFNGDIMNPILNIEATDAMKATVANSSGNSSLVNFLVTLNATGSLSNPKVSFDLSTNDDLSLQNELQSMSPDQRSTQAMNLLITGRYQGAGMKTTSGPMAENMLYSFLTSQLNSWAAKNIRGVDLSFGVDQYDTTTDGRSSSSTSYSYQVSKSLFNNRFKIVVGGNYSTDASADENFAQNLISDISFEYTLKQTTNLTMLVRLFRHTGFESILEGEVTETGVGFTMRRRLSTLKNLFKVHWGKRKPRAITLPADSAIAPADATKPEDIRMIRENMRDSLQNGAASVIINEEKKGGEK